MHEATAADRRQWKRRRRRRNRRWFKGFYREIGNIEKNFFVYFLSACRCINRVHLASFQMPIVNDAFLSRPWKRDALPIFATKGPTTAPSRCPNGHPNSDCAASAQRGGERGSPLFPPSSFLRRTRRFMTLQRGKISSSVSGAICKEKHFPRKKR